MSERQADQKTPFRPIQVPPPPPSAKNQQSDTAQPPLSQPQESPKPGDENAHPSLPTGCNLRLHVHHKAAPEFTLDVNASDTCATIGQLKKTFIDAYNRKHSSAHALTEINVPNPDAAFKDRDDVHIQRADARVEQTPATRPRRAAAAESDSDQPPEKYPRAEDSPSPSAPRSFSASYSSLPDVLYADLRLVRSSSALSSLSSLRPTSPLPSSSVTPAPVNVTAQTEGMELAGSSATSAVNPAVELAGSTPAVNFTAQQESMELSASPAPDSVAPTEGAELAASVTFAESAPVNATTPQTAEMEIAALVPPMQPREEQSSSSDHNDSQTSTTHNDADMGDSDNHSHDSDASAAAAALHVPVTPPGVTVTPPDPTLLSELIENAPEVAAPFAPM